MKPFKVNILGRDCLFDREDFFKYYEYGYGITHDGAGFYYVQFNCKPYRSKRFSRVLLSAPSNMIVDHIDRNTLNNCKTNLRLVSTSQSAINREVTWRGEHLPGAYKRDGFWVSSISVNNKKIYLGTFVTEQDAHNAYVRAQQTYHKDHLPVPAALKNGTPEKPAKYWNETE